MRHISWEAEKCRIVSKMSKSGKITFIANSWTRSPAQTGWVWASMSPGTTLLPFKSITRSKETFAYRFSISASRPKSRIQPVLQNGRILYNFRFLGPTIYVQERYRTQSGNHWEITKPFELISRWNCHFYVTLLYEGKFSEIERKIRLRAVNWCEKSRTGKIL